MYNLTLEQAEIMSDLYDIDLPYTIAMALRMQADEQRHAELQAQRNETALRYWLDTSNVKG